MFGSVLPLLLASWRGKVYSIMSLEGKLTRTKSCKNASGYKCQIFLNSNVQPSALFRQSVIAPF
jgi:hypothetical protein